MRLCRTSGRAPPVPIIGVWGILGLPGKAKLDIGAREDRDKAERRQDQV